ncbi:hypothetical protein K5V21_01730 [Clostridium sardiniense]|uniref:LSM domain-containing protein n=2 Tax=Clostridium sardiniense TaxID=29369 RepID=A0ABS7KU33_CLOSR|nr:hypothetical protein [Clostridium sardiniense]
MSLEETNYHRDTQSLYTDCKRCLNYHVMITLKDGSKLDGIVVEVQPDRVMVLVGEDVMEQDHGSESELQRQPIGFGRPMRRFRSFRPRFFPFGALATVALLQYPFIMPPYPYFF